jgi:hypothetical protein
MSNSNGKTPDKRPNGAPRGNKNALTHGVIALRNQVRRRIRRGRSLIDRRTAAGKNAVAFGEALRSLVIERGGEESLTEDTLLLIEQISRDVYYLDETDRRNFKAIYKMRMRERELERLERAQGKKPSRIRNPEAIRNLYGYRAAPDQKLTDKMRDFRSLLGSLKPKVKSLEEILAEDEEEQHESPA